MARWDLDITQGGRHDCTPSWCGSGGESHAKFYAVVNGSARYALGERETSLQRDHAYLIPPHPDQHYACDRSMEVHWVHFRAESLILHRRLALMGTIVSWPLAQWTFFRDTYENLDSYVRARDPILGMRVQAMLLCAVSDGCIRSGVLAEPSRSDPMIERLSPVLAVLDQSLHRHLSMGDLARMVGMSVVHFHRSFRNAFGCTPHDYVIRKRMDLARQLLVTSSRRVGDIAVSCGYGDPFYFSRAFKRHHGMSPMAARRAHVDP